MWVDTYPYVRLHQPHPMFTAGNIGWAWDRPPGYLPWKSEVLDHFQHCLDTIKKDVGIDEFFGWTTESDIESSDGARITCRSADGRTMAVEAKRLIKAYGVRVTPNDPLPVSSRRVQSVSPLVSAATPNGRHREIYDEPSARSPSPCCGHRA